MRIHSRYGAIARLRSQRHRSSPATLLCAGLLLGGCGSGGQSTTETTAPTLSWGVLNQSTKEHQELPANATIQAGSEDQYVITLKANDAGGVQKISLGGGASWSCSDGSLGQNRYAAYTPQSATLHPDSKGEVEHYTFLLMTVSPNGWDCAGSSFHFVHGSATLGGAARNYSNREAHASLTIVRSS